MNTELRAKPPLVIIAGPTASGKSAAAVALAHRLNGAVISADSMQVYRGMDIGSAKITEAERKNIPHYLIDCAEPDEEWNVVRFQKEAARTVREIAARGQLPILCGGTGFYIQALLYDIDFTETEEDAAYREELSAFAAKRGAEALHERLRAADPEAAESIHPHNIKRVIRALEFVRQSGGQRISEHNREQRLKKAAYRAVFFALTMNRATLYERIDRRVDRMFGQGLIGEVTRLRERGFTDRDVSMQGLGYKEVLRALDGQYSMEEAKERIRKETRHFSKRQLSWFRRERDVTWIDRDAFPDENAMLDRMEAQIREELCIFSQETQG
ncbi:tRNA (adenosine(37)-N6)-dimethylallyltransferase MiaA [Lachnoclostridium sp. Marseille-P6806]|uniref:tRNA (adenosine(37)-N6)-dimethylallyltransferase MiaA n=1 Tax=Lachnoclostridium sp. Marseille-P6806 TaxID=2364793 RepID=UPI00103225C8|nr:tRNA (adenosine(37)-N6)-dimethylallyltransferase MiaA [Lachnoclostridium sp. Marseille-P6806]